jgi:hypothetical protein
LRANDLHGDAGVVAQKGGQTLGIWIGGHLVAISGSYFVIYKEEIRTTNDEM